MLVNSHSDAFVLCWLIVFFLSVEIVALIHTCFTFTWCFFVIRWDLMKLK